MFKTRQNYHHSKLPEIGSIGYINLPGYVYRKCVVSHYPLCDSCLPYSKGIHTMFVRFLDNGSYERFSGHHFQEERPDGYPDRYAEFVTRLLDEGRYVRFMQATGRPMKNYHIY